MDDSNDSDPHNKNEKKETKKQSIIRKSQDTGYAFLHKKE